MNYVSVLYAKYIRSIRPHRLQSQSLTRAPGAQANSFFFFCFIISNGNFLIAYSLLSLLTESLS